MQWYGSLPNFFNKYRAMTLRNILASDSPLSGYNNCEITVHRSNFNLYFWVLIFILSAVLLLRLEYIYCTLGSISMLCLSWL